MQRGRKIFEKKGKGERERERERERGLTLQSLSDGIGTRNTAGTHCR